MIFKSKTYRRATQLRNELLKERLNISLAKKSKISTTEYCKLVVKDNDLKEKITLIDKILGK